MNDRGAVDVEIVAEEPRRAAGPNREPTTESWHELFARLHPALALTLDDAEQATVALEHTIASIASAAPADGGHSAVAVHARALSFSLDPRRHRSSTTGGPAVWATGDAASEDHDVINIIADLPVRQRAALVADVALQWRGDDLATSLGTSFDNAQRRVSRARQEIERRLPGDVDGRAAAHRAITHLLDQAGAKTPTIDPARLRRSGKRRRNMKRIAVSVLAVLCIAVVGSIVRSEPETQIEMVGPASVAPPRGSQQPFAPIADGSGGFVAIEPRGFDVVASADGAEWFAAGDLNVKQIDLRLDVEHVTRSDGRFLALVGSTTGGGRSASGSDMPRLAVAESTDRWQSLAVTAAAVPDVPGLRPRLDLHGAAAVDDRILLTGVVDYEVDYRAQRLRLGEVCSVADDDAGIVLHQCDGTAIEVTTSTERETARLGDTGRLFASEALGPFDELATPDGFNPHGLFAFAGRFAMIDQATTQVSVSDDGTAWDTLVELEIDNRLGIVTADDDEALIVGPSGVAWSAYVLAADTVRSGRLPLAFDPTEVWLKPVVASGPAGWAMFVTTSQPWDRRGDGQFGWAVHTDNWIVERKIETGDIVLRSTVDNTRYDYQRLTDGRGQPLPHPHVERGLFGGVALRNPATGDLLVTVTGDDIRNSWTTGERSTAPADGSIEWQGVTITGDLRRGPLSFTVPGESPIVISDGFSATNGSTTDGVETDLFDGAIEPVLSLYRSGRELASVPLSALAPLAAPSAAAGDDDALRAVVLWAPDGVEWQVIWESRRDTWFGSVAVGDDEVLLSASGLLGEPERIPVPPN